MTSASKTFSRFGRVSSVFVDGDADDIFVNVVTNPNREPRRIKFTTPQTGFWMVPREGDTVEVHKVAGTNVARWPMKSPEDPGLPTDLSEGDVCLKLNEDTELHFSIQDDGTVDVELSADGDLNLSLTGGNLNLNMTEGSINAVLDKGNISAEATLGDVTVTAPEGTARVNAPAVEVGDPDETPKPVARKGDPVSVDSNGNGQIDSGSPSVQSS